MFAPRPSSGLKITRAAKPAAAVVEPMTAAAAATATPAAAVGTTLATAAAIHHRVHLRHLPRRSRARQLRRRLRPMIGSCRAGSKRKIRIINVREFELKEKREFLCSRFFTLENGLESRESPVFWAHNFRAKAAGPVKWLEVR